MREIEFETKIPKKEKLRIAFIKLQEVNPFRNISNGGEWQDQIREEWESGIIRKQDII
ncbi:MAG: hypothetical protein WCP85_09935 [Mariniphaga sp.]